MDAPLHAAARAPEVTRQIPAPSARRASPAASRILLLAAAAVLLRASAGTAGGPLLTEDGEPYRWDTDDPVAIHLDQGPLGAISGDDVRSVVELAIQEWNAVGTSEFRFELGDPLPIDVEDYSENKFYNFVTKNDGTNPVIYDSSGAITDAIFGPGSGVLGAAGPSLLVPSSAKLVKGFAIFNGKEFTEDSTTILRAVITHELGHFLGLGHSQTNGTRVGGTIPGFLGTVETEDVETMFPLLIDAAEQPHPMSTLHKDDVAAISTLYPTPAFSATTGSLQGDVLDFDGTTPLQGINVIARNVANPFADAVSCVSGALAGGRLGGSGLGGWALRGLTPGATYLVYIEEVGGFFVGGASVGPLDPPLDVDSTDLAAFLEFWSGEDESAENPPDDPSAGQGILVEAGRSLGGIDFLFNGTAPRVYALTPASGLYDEPQQIQVTGANFLDVISVRLDCPVPIYLDEVEAPAPNTLILFPPRPFDRCDRWHGRGR